MRRARRILDLLFFAVAMNAAVVTLVPPAVPWHVLPIFLYTIGSSLMMPSVTLLLLDLFPTMRGLGSSLQGFAGTIAPLLAPSVVALMLGMLAFSTASACAWLVYRARSPAAHPLR